MVVDGPITPPMTPSEGEDHEETANMDLDAQYADADRSLSPRAPLRLLEDEQVHSMKRGTLHLNEFEIRGTLG